MTKSISVGLPRVSVIIPHLNTPELLVRCLQSVAGQRIDYGWFEIIVVDNGSQDTLDVLKASWPGVLFLREQQPGQLAFRTSSVPCDPLSTTIISNQP